MKKHLLLLFALILAAGGCASTIEVGKNPLIVSQPAESPKRLPVTIGLVKLQRPLATEQKFDEPFPLHLANAIEAGMLAACRLVDPQASLVAPGADVDILLIPSNPFFEVSQGTYDVEVTLSMDVRVIQKGDKNERGFLVESVGLPGPARPSREVELLGARWGLIGSRIPRSKLERAINQALFDFSVQFAEKTARRTERYVLTRGQ